MRKILLLITVAIFFTGCTKEIILYETINEKGGINMALPNTGISIPLVASELGTTESDLGRLCVHENINPLSKYKPVRSPDNDPYTGNPDWWKTPNGMCSFEIPNSTNYKTAATLQWVYLRPTGQLASPYRLGDFAGYEKNADSDICSGYKAQISIALDDLTGGLTFGQVLPIAPNSIKASDLDASDLSGYYFSVIIEAPGGAKIQKSASQTIGNGGKTVTFAKNEIDIALYEKQLSAYVVLSYNSLNESESGGNYYPACTFNGYMNQIPVYISNVLSLDISSNYFLYDLPATIQELSSAGTIELYRKYAVVLTITNNFTNYQFPLRLSTFRFSYTDFFINDVVEETATQWGTNADGGSTFTALGVNDVIYLPVGESITLAYMHDYFLRGNSPPANGTEVNTGFKVVTVHNGQTKTVANTLVKTYKLNTSK